MAFDFVIHARAASCKNKKKHPNFYFHEIETKYHLSFWSFSRIKCKTLKNPRQTTVMLEKAPLNFPVYALRDIERLSRRSKDEFSLTEQFLR